MLRLPPIYIIDRTTGKREQEQVYGEIGLALLYRTGLLGRFLRAPITRPPLFSQLFGWLQSRPQSRNKIRPFIERYGLDATEFVKELDEFESFNDFFTREIKPDRRPLAPDGHLICPADGRYRVFERLPSCFSLAVKNQKGVTLHELLGDQELAKRYDEGCLVAIRLCPLDCHRVYFPCSGKVSKPRLINGFLRSVNPAALKQNFITFAQNKRFVTEIDSPEWGHLTCIEVGATSVGSVQQLFDPDTLALRGQPKCIFSFGGSAVLLLIEPGRIQFDPQMIHPNLEVKCLIGQSLGVRAGEDGS